MHAWCYEVLVPDTIEATKQNKPQGAAVPGRCLPQSASARLP